MKTIELKISNKNKPRQLLATLKRKNLKRGDRLKLNTTDNNQSIAVVVTLLMVIIAWYFSSESKKTKSFGESVEEILFDSKISAEEFEKKLLKEYGISIEVSESSDDIFWKKLSSKSLAKAYDDSEPDYKDAKVLEPNPKYKK